MISVVKFIDEESKKDFINEFSKYMNNKDCSFLGEVIGQLLLVECALNKRPIEVE